MGADEINQPASRIRVGWNGEGGWFEANARNRAIITELNIFQAKIIGYSFRLGLSQVCALMNAGVYLNIYFTRQ